MLAQLIQFLRLRKTQNILLGVFFVFLFSFGLTRLAMASVLGDIGQGFLNALLAAVGLIYGVVFNILGTLTGFFLGVAVLIFNWVCSPAFISLSYTNAGLSLGDPNFNQFVGVGWELTRSLTNIIFVVAMVAIGIGTALRISGYQAQQALKNLVIIALLVNFTPVIAGLIIDASNITMGFFVNPEGTAAGSLIWQKSTSQWQNISQLVGGGNAPWSPTGGPQAFAAAAASLALVFFNLAAALIYLLFAGVFIMRYIALWLLIILSPFAFACYILPYTRGVWTQWWKMFIQWSIVGIIAGFFIYLSEHLYSAVNSVSFAESSARMNDFSAAPGLAPIINGLLPSLIPIVLLFVGLAASIAGAPSAAQGILKAGERGMKAAGKTFGTTYAKRAWEGAKKMPGRIKDFRPIKMGASTYGVQHGWGGKTKREAFGAAIKTAAQETVSSIKAAPKAMGGALKAAPGKAWVAAKSGGKDWLDVVKGKRPATQGVAQAFSDSAKAGWKAATKAKKKKKGDICPACKKPLEVDSDFCLNPVCRNYGKVFT